MKPRSAIREVLIFSAFSVMSILVVAPMIAEAAFFIDATGGDCALIGDWKTDTCTLTRDVIFTDLSNGIEVMSDGITIDGAGHLLMGIQGDMVTDGVYLLGRSGITVKNLRIEGFFTGIHLEGASGNTLMHNAIAYNYDGMRVSGSFNNTIVGNIVHTNDSGIFLYGNHWLWGGNASNVIMGNVTYDNGCCGINLSTNNDNNVILGNTSYGQEYYGIVLYGPAMANTVRANIVSGNGEAGLLIISGPENTVVADNDLIDETWPVFSESATSTFSANYWSSYDEPGEGCVDPDDDGDCDDPFVVRMCDYNWMVCDPDSYGGADAEASVYSRVLGASVEVVPVPIRSNSKVFVRIEIPGHDLATIDQRTVALHTDLGMIWAETDGSAIGDSDRDGVPDLTMKVDTAKILAIMNGSSQPVWVTAVVGDRTLEGSNVVGMSMVQTKVR